MVSPEEGDLPDELWNCLLENEVAAPSYAGTSGRPSCASPYGQRVTLTRGDLLHGVDQAVRQFYVLLDVSHLNSHIRCSRAVLTMQFMCVGCAMLKFADSCLFEGGTSLADDVHAQRYLQCIHVSPI